MILDKNGNPYKPTQTGPVSFIPNTQKHSIKLKGKIEALKVLQHNLERFPGTEEHEAVHQMSAITQMQLEYGIKALSF